MTTHNLPAIAGKTVKTIITTDFDGNIEEVRIFFTDGTVLVCASSFCATGLEGYVSLRLEPAPTIVSARSDWPGE